MTHAVPVAHDDRVGVPGQQLPEQITEPTIGQPAPNHHPRPDVVGSQGKHVVHLTAPGLVGRVHVGETKALANQERNQDVTYVIAEPCVDLKDKACIEECPVDCIYEGKRSLYIQPDECVDCGACEPVCPVEAIFYEDDTPAQWKDYYRANVDFFTETTTIGSPGGASKVGPIDLDHPVIMAVPLGQNTEGH